VDQSERVQDRTPTRRVAAVLRRLGSLLATRGRRRRDASRLVRPWRGDYTRTYPGRGLTPARALGFIQAADHGWPQSQFELFTEMLQKWPRLAAVEATRRLALTGLEWELTPDPVAARTSAADAGRGARRAAAERAADFCRATLTRLESWRDVLDHLATAIGHGLAVAELVWERGTLVDLVPVPHTRLLTDPHQPWRLCVRTAAAPHTGVPLDEHPAKWLIHQPHAVSGQPFGGGLLRASLLLFLAQHLSFKDWLVYSQIAGMPVRVALFDLGTSDEDQARLLDMLRTLGTEAAAVLGKNVDLHLLDAARGERPYAALQEYCNTEVTILWLGQHLTTDIRNSGSRAAAEIHDRVREDLLVDDIADEARTIQRDVLAPLVRASFGDDAPVPQFRRSLVQAVDTKVLVDTLAVAVNELGLTVPRAWVHRALGIPQATAGEGTL
jgi:phage gp29-like protein